MIDYRLQQYRSPSIYGNFWFNTDAFSISDLQGHVVVIEFWDYSSVSSLRSLPYLQEWSRKYRDFGVVVVGIHTPAFGFGRERENLEAAIRNLGIEYPVVADNDGLVWTAFGSRAWPTKFVIDKDGFIRLSRAGEGGYDQVERMIQSLLVGSGIHGDLPDLTPPIHPTDIPGVVCYKATGDIQTGYLRGVLGNTEGYGPEGTLDYVDQGVYLPGRFYLGGKWMCGRESVVYEGAPGEEGSVAVRYEATEINAVLGPGEKKPSLFLVHQDGAPLPVEIRGKDIKVGSDGATRIVVDKPGLFNLVRNREFGEFVVTLRTVDPSVHVYSFSFVTSPIVEAVHSN